MAIAGKSGQVRQAVILAGGQATRLRPYTDDRPKAMVPVADKPIVDWQLEWLSEQGCENVVISCGYLADVLEKHLAGHAYSLSIDVAVEREPLGRGGGPPVPAGGSDRPACHGRRGGHDRARAVPDHLGDRDPGRAGPHRRFRTVAEAAVLDQRRGVRLRAEPGGPAPGKGRPRGHH